MVATNEQSVFNYGGCSLNRLAQIARCDDFALIAKMNGLSQAILIDTKQMILHEHGRRPNCAPQANLP